MDNKTSDGRIPVSVSLEDNPELKYANQNRRHSSKRILYITSLAVAIAACISAIAFVLMKFIFLITNLSFYGKFSFENIGPAANQLGLWVILIPVIGGIAVGVMILYGSKDIRGHGIPEAMEQILLNKSKMDPIITYLKPIASAFAIGSGGPFGAEGPVISTGGALGSTLGQITKISDNERKILLAAGAASGMAAIFGTPIAGIFLAIELLLFEFSPRSIIPVSLACVTGGAGHQIFFDSAPFFAMDFLAIPDYKALLLYSVLGLIIGVLSVGVSKFVYIVEDLYNKIPMHYMWYPAIGGIVVGVIGFFAPRTLGVGYGNITDLLTGSLSVQIVLGLCVLKFLSWGISLASGTAGGTLAPLFIIGGATGSLIGLGLQYLFPDVEISIHMAALLGMAAMFSGASRAVLTSIVFAVETTGQANALLPLLAACLAAYLVSFILMENTIMTEKIARRGVHVPESYTSDWLVMAKVGNFVKSEGFVISEESTVGEVRAWLYQHKKYRSNYFVVSDEEGKFTGILSSSSLFGEHRDISSPIQPLVKRKNIFVRKDDNMRKAVSLMANEDIDVLPVIEREKGKSTIVGVLGYQDVLSSYKDEMSEFKTMDPDISLRNKTLSILRKGKYLQTKSKDDK